MIPDPPVLGAIEFCQEARLHFELVVVSTRSTHPGGREAIQDWLSTFGFIPMQVAEDGKKPPAFLTIDDRALLFTGKFPDDPRKLLAFRPWNKKGTKVGQPNPTWLALKKLYDNEMEQQLQWDEPNDLLPALAEILRETEHGN